jgi:hypothetical protein
LHELLAGEEVCDDDVQDLVFLQQLERRSHGVGSQNEIGLEGTVKEPLGDRLERNR